MTSRDSRFASEAERQRAIARLSPAKPSSSTSAAASAKRFGTKNAFGGSTRGDSSATRGDEVNRARNDAVRRKEERRKREARGLMDTLRAAIDEAPVNVEGFATMGVVAQATVASELVAFLCDERGFGVVESMFGVVAWMSDTIDDAASEAENAARLSRGDRGEGAPSASADLGDKETREDDSASGARGFLSAWLRQYFAIDVVELEDGRKEIQVDASAEFLAVFILLLAASSQFGAQLVELVTNGGPIDPLLR